MKTIKGEKALIREVEGDNVEYKYWVYEITPLKNVLVKGINMLFGGNIIYYGMYKTYKEALEQYNLLNSKK